MSGVRDPGRTMGSFLTLRLGLGTASYGVAVLFAAVGPYPPSLTSAMAIGALTLVFGAGWNALFLYFQSRLRLAAISVVLILSRVVFLGLVLFFTLSDTGSLQNFLWASVVTEALPLVALTILIRREIGLSPAVELGRWWRWLKDAIPIAVGYAVGSIYFRVDIVMLSLLGTEANVGLYGIGYKFADLLSFLSAAIMVSAFPLLLGAWPLHMTSFRRNWRGTFILSTIAAFAGTTGFLVFARPAIVSLFGSKYEPATDAARLVVIGQGLRFFTSFCVTTLVVAGRNTAYVFAALFGLLVNVVANTIVIPRYSYLGAAWVTVGTEVGVLVLLVLAVSKIPELHRLPWGILPRAALAAAALVIVGFLLDVVVPWPLAAVGALAAFVVVLHLVGVDGPGGVRVLPHLLSQEGLPMDGAHTRTAIP